MWYTILTNWKIKTIWSWCMSFLMCFWILFAKILLRIFAAMFISASTFWTSYESAAGSKQIHKQKVIRKHFLAWQNLRSVGSVPENKPYSFGRDACCDGEEKYACRTLKHCLSQASRASEGCPAQRMSETHSMRRSCSPWWKSRAVSSGSAWSMSSSPRWKY